MNASFHNIKEVKLEAFSPDNSNAISLELITGEGGYHSLNIFGLPDDKARKLVAALELAQ